MSPAHQQAVEYQALQLPSMLMVHQTWVAICSATTIALCSCLVMPHYEARM